MVEIITSLVLTTVLMAGGFVVCAAFGCVCVFSFTKPSDIEDEGLQFLCRLLFFVIFCCSFGVIWEYKFNSADGVIVREYIERNMTEEEKSQIRLFTVKGGHVTWSTYGQDTRRDFRVEYVESHGDYKIYSPTASDFKVSTSTNNSNGWLEDLR